ncbi:Scr1 family TA system antitoxin-like transcriptional regulator [Glycomyces xiaoerkulensis]|uniref:Scr1 family TA system antitoxin-like transcriptional regulator n=1 Tax=Glycomyces xiaoerkulensis TaxID=2038139 RepID=UPI0012FFD300|nr:Scr1 family TA system antitoxin-like transcriptional regulator [Glycomyces xiaoerkulensis]
MQVEAQEAPTMPESQLAKWFPGRVVKTRRDARKITQAEVGAFLGRDYQTVGKWEHGKKCPDVGQVYALAEFLDIPKELRDYMVEIARNEARQNFQADRRFNALCLHMGERYMGGIFKYEPYFIPGIAQSRPYHYNIFRLAWDVPEAALDRGWPFKRQRQRDLCNRSDDPTVRILIGEQALRHLRYLSEEDRVGQIDRLLELDALPNWEIKVVVGPHPEGGGAFEIYRSDGAENGGPTFVYTEVWDDSWCIEEAPRIARYDELWKVLWQKSIALKEYLDDRPDGLA